MAQERFTGVILPSPLVRSSYFSHLFGFEIFLKLENLQETGSFKVRRAYNRLLHGYFDVHLDIVWDTILDDLPPLVKDLEGITTTGNAPQKG